VVSWPSWVARWMVTYSRMTVSSPSVTPTGVPWIADDQVERLYAAATWLRRRHRWARRVRVELVTVEGWRLRRRGVL